MEEAKVFLEKQLIEEFEKQKQDQIKAQQLKQVPIFSIFSLGFLNLVYIKNYIFVTLFFFHSFKFI